MMGRWLSLVSAKGPGSVDKPLQNVSCQAYRVTLVQRLLGNLACGDRFVIRDIGKIDEARNRHPHCECLGTKIEGSKNVLLRRRRERGGVHGCFLRRGTG